MADSVVTRFAPSPTGYLHIGHAYSALDAWYRALEAGGRFILRIEDIDRGRCRSEYEDAIYEDLAWLGLDWELPVRRQSDHMADYAEALARLDKDGLLYPCFCTRGDIKAEIERMGGAPHKDEGAVVYPGICRNLSDKQRLQHSEAGTEHAIRLRMDRAVETTGPLHWNEAGRGQIRTDVRRHGDIVLARKDIPTSYHLAVTVDDALQGITMVTRGEELADFTDIHRLLQEMLGLTVPNYHHHRMLTDEQGKRFSKRDKSLTIRALREAGSTPAEVRAMSGFSK